MTAYVWRRTTGGKRAHAVDAARRLSHYFEARCGITPVWYDPQGWIDGGEFTRCGRCVRLIRSESKLTELRDALT